ncbi:hypothetical protein CDD83_9008 [Cordyceps sp. RAO-2017]|nr:hypothetical protein CDD83_9008 [Cordyceps sp. RAO-2017]
MKTQALLPLLGLWAAAASARSPQAGPLLQRLHGFKEAPAEPRAESAPDQAIRARSEQHKYPRFLNSKTAQFVVNGSGIPEVDFDVGESYAGQLPISDHAKERDHLYFWFFPTANKEHRHKKEIVIWLNGGPGCSSLLGFLQENGPFLWPAGTLKPQRNPWSWHLLTNVVWVEQPVTVGFSQGNATARDEDDIARQFLGFWKNFIRTFSMQGYKVYVAAESYGGYYGPYISSHMIDAKDHQHFNLGGLLVYDGIMFNDMVQSNVIAEAFVEQHHDVMPLDDGIRAQIRNISASCGFADHHRRFLTYPPAGPQPRVPPGTRELADGSWETRSECDGLFNLVFSEMRLINPCFNIYNVPDHCPEVYDPIGRLRPYFDRADVKKAINAPAGVQWSQCVNGVFVGPGDRSAPPDKYELPNVVDRTGNVILAHGSMDFILPLNGVLLGLQNMTWGGRRGFQTRPSDPFYVPRYGFTGARPDGRPFYGQNLPAASGVLGTTHHERGLSLVVTHLAGHEGPGYSAASAFRHLEKLVGRVRSMSETTPFTLPELRNITQVKRPLGRGTVRIPCLQRGC